MRHVAGTVLAAIACTFGVEAVALAEFAIEKAYPLGDEVQVGNEQHDWVLNRVLTEVLDLNVSGVRIGTSEKDVVKLLGKPTRINRELPEGYRDGYRIYEYPGLSIEIIDDERSVVNHIDIESGQWNVNGISVGSSVDDVRRLWGRPLNEGEEGLYYFDMSELDVQVAIENGRVVGVHWLYDDC